MNPDRVWDVVAAAQAGITKLSPEQTLELVTAAVSQQKTHTLAPLLPLLLNLNNQPYSLADYAPFECLFSTFMPRKIILKCARQTSKCLQFFQDHNLRRSNGHQIEVSDLKVGDELLSLNDSFRFVAGKVANIWDTGSKTCIRIKTRMGSELNVTPEHKLRTLYGYTEAGELKLGNRLAAVRRGGLFYNKRITRDRVILTAYMIGDGCTVKNLSFTGAKGPALDEFIKVANRRESAGVKSYPRKENPNNISVHLHKDHSLCWWLKSDGLYNKYSHEKFIPSWVFNLTEESTILFLSRLWATDGLIKSNKKGFPEISYCSTSRQLASDVRCILNKLGIPASIHQREAGYKDVNGVYVRCHDAFIVRVETRAGWQRFLTRIKVPGKPAISIPTSSTNNNRDTIPIEIESTIQELYGPMRRGSLGNTLYGAGLRRNLKYPLGCSNLNSYILCLEKDNPNHPKIKFLKDLRDGDVIWDEVTSIEDIGKQPTCDLEIETYGNYVCDGIVSHNSTSVAAHGIILASMSPGKRGCFHTLYVTPLYEQIRRFSNNYVKPFIDKSPIKSLLVDTNTNNNVLQRTFKNGSIMYFSYAGQTADRARGIPCDRVVIDEAQDVASEHVDIIEPSMDASEWGISQFTGTPKTRDNPLEKKWQSSSQAEWIIRCEACLFDNIPAIGWHLEKNLGPWHPDISEARPGIICYKCGRPIFPRKGRWIHRYPERKLTYAGYHVSQAIMPMHYENQEKWSVLLSKRDTLSPATFYNETLGESCDIATKLVSVTDLERAGVLWENTEEEASKHINKYAYRVLGVDWGGGGRDGVSYTTLAIVGFLPDGKIDVLFGKRSMVPHDHVAEANECRRLFQRFNCTLIAHDYTGAGTLRETLLVQSGFPMERLMPISYVRTANKNIITFIPATDQHPRSHHRLDKARSLQLTCYAIKLGIIKTFKYDTRNPGVLEDFTALVENSVPTSHGSNIYTIQSEAGRSDDFAHSVNLACCALWHMNSAWPDLANIESKWHMSPQDEDAMGPIDRNPWS